ncbi:MAG: hypothetical protein ACI4PQ_07570 [Butyricicoccaceae bacterium]
MKTTQVQERTTMDSMDILTSIISNTAGISEALGRRTMITELIGEIGEAKWLEIYDQLEELYGEEMWKGMCCYCLGDLCDRIDALESEREGEE